MTVNRNVESYTIGFRFKEMFKLLDLWGSIADEFLHDTQYFSNEYFNYVSQNNNFECMLTNRKTGSYLKITARDIIFCHTITDNEGNEFEWFKNCILNFIVEKVIRKYEINTFVRVGIVFSHQYDDRLIYDKLINKVINKDTGNVNDIRFSVKSTHTESLILKGKDDYINKIYTLEINQQNKPQISFDYQYYMRPMIRDIKDCKIGSFLERAKKSLNDDLYNWISEVKNGENKRQKK